MGVYFFRCLQSLKTETYQIKPGKVDLQWKNSAFATKQKNDRKKNCYCPDILIQVAAANAALNSFNKVLLGNHIRTCVARDIREGKDETIDELVGVLQKLMK